MTGSSPILNSFCLLSILISSGADGVKIQVYGQPDFTELVWESNSTDDCTNIPRDKRDWVYSIRTDTCYIAYNDPDCKSTWSQKYMPGDMVLSSAEFRLIYSFQLCDEEDGGSQLNLDITKYYWDVDVPDVLESYKNVCSCVNVPQHVQNMDYWSINNHYNALLAYYEPDCKEKKWNSIFIRAGHSYDSRDVHEYERADSVTKTTFKYQSFGPDPNSTYFQTSCNASHVTITESSKTFMTENQMSFNADYNKRFEVLTKQIADLQANQSDIRKEQSAFFTNLTQTVTQLKQGFLDFAAKVKSDLQDLFA